MESFFKDLRQSLRMFWQSRGFTAAAVAALALGIGANTAIFSVVNAVLLKPVPFPDPERLVLLQTTSPQGVNGGGSPAKLMHYREQTQVIRDVAAFNTGVVNYTGGAFPEQLRSGRVSADFFKAVWHADPQGAHVQRRRGSPRRRQGRRAQLPGLDAPFRQRPQHHRQDHFAQQQPVCGHRRPGPERRFRGARARPRGLAGVSVRSEHEGPGALLQSGRPAGAGRVARAGQRAPEALLERLHSEVPQRPRPEHGVRSGAAS